MARAKRVAYCGRCRKAVADDDRYVVRVVSQRLTPQGSVGIATSQVSVCGRCADRIFEVAVETVKGGLDEDQT
jgi:hypothetical protein